ncbi:unnamed protein product [Caenorhabditis sp. 36 PRJEB53466]|nr:unnamed protein product [Caenorhabditis sp. 36 PRJEB53466]
MKSLKELSAAAFEKDPLYGLQTWRTINPTEDPIDELIVHPQYLSEFVADLLQKLYVAWNIQRVVPESIIYFGPKYKVNQEAIQHIRNTIWIHFQKLKWWYDRYSIYALSEYHAEWPDSD